MYHTSSVVLSITSSLLSLIFCIFNYYVFLEFFLCLNLASCPVSLLPISKQLQMILFQDCFFLSLPRNTNISSHYWQRHEIKVKQLNNPLKKRYLWAAEDIFLPIRSIQIFVCLSGLYIRWQIRKCISSSFCYFLFSLCCFRSSFTDSEREQNNYYYWKKHVWHLNIALIGTELKYKVSDCLQVYS